MQIKNNKIYIEFDGTERGVATDFPEAGVDPDQMVLAFHHPPRRHLSEFSPA